MARIVVVSDDPSFQGTIQERLHGTGHDLKQIFHVHDLGGWSAEWNCDLALIDGPMMGAGATAFAVGKSAMARRVVLVDDAKRHPAALARAGGLALSRPEVLAHLVPLIEGEGQIETAGGAPGSRLHSAPRWSNVRHVLVRARNRFFRAMGRIFDAYVKVYAHGGVVCEAPKEATTLEFRGRLLLGLYERPELELVRRHVDREATVLELGGCLGVVACSMNRRLSDGRRHVVLEAHPLLVGFLQRNRERNSCRFEVRHAVISRQEKMDFYVRDPFIAGGSTVRMGSRKIEVPTTSVAALEQAFNLSFDTLFIDIEGGELVFFEENPEFLSRLRTVIIETHPKIIGAAGCDRIRAQFAAAGLSRARAIGDVEAWTRAV